MDTDQLYHTYKPLLFSLAYRMMGSVMDAEDIVQEAFLSLSEASSGEKILNMKAYLCKTVTNRCLDILRSSAKKREMYVGPWLPEPLAYDRERSDSNGGAISDPARSYLRKESMSTAYLLLLQQLSAVERAVFLLREVFEYEYDEIAAIVGKSSSNCRQIFHRAKRSIGDFPEDSAELKATRGVQVEQFAEFLAAGNIMKLLQLLAPDAILLSDGGGKVNAPIHPIFTAERIGRFFDGVWKKSATGLSYRLLSINGEPGMIARADNYKTAWSFQYRDDKISHIYLVANPDKLAHIRFDDNGGRSLILG
ncbi:RNA polymerase sigma-70 factor [Paenibacillus hamazuiensis]|uniref:RNA polymerase sigma-70 factor n=1 Tax=Paenibacillus hamazuiensis TaxID=2936508 RepID=UPI00200D4C11